MPRQLHQFVERHALRYAGHVALRTDARPRWLVIVPSLSSEGTPARVQSIGITVRLRMLGQLAKQGSRS